MDVNPSRPISIWITQILILIAGIPLTLLVLVTTFYDLMFVASGQVNATLVLWLVARIRETFGVL